MILWLHGGIQKFLCHVKNVVNLRVNPMGLASIVMLQIDELITDIEEHRKIGPVIIKISYIQEGDIVTISPIELPKLEKE